MERTPPFTAEGSEEIFHELEHGSPNTPERLATFRRADALTFLVERELADNSLMRAVGQPRDNEPRKHGGSR
jgi:hypothetical protein